jgi:hypothetical protein
MTPLRNCRFFVAGLNPRTWYLGYKSAEGDPHPMGIAPLASCPLTPWLLNPATKPVIIL